MPSAESDTGYILVGREKGFEVATLSTACWSSSDARRASEDPSLLPTGWPDVNRANGSYVRHTIVPMARRRSEEVGGISPECVVYLLASGDSVHVHKKRLVRFVQRRVHAAR